MTKRMLIDGTHAEETRVVVLDGNRLEDFDVETSTKRQLKGNIYLAKIVRVEPSLQAAFVEYGGNRHGFLAFGEIHPDYYQIPVADRQRLLAAQAEEAREEAEADERADAAGEPRPASAPPAGDDFADVPFEPVGAEADDPGADAAAPVAASDWTDSAEEAGHTAGLGEAAETAPDATRPAIQSAMAFDRIEAAAPAEPEAGATSTLDADDGEPEAEADSPPHAPPPETVGGEADPAEEARERRKPARFLRNYKIQEVIHRRQILLVQVVKEERGTKGAALTTYLSLAGRYCVLMPNSPRGGGISRKITSAADRKRLKEITAELEIPDGMGLIVRTAGAQRPKPEIRRDCEYLLRLWDDIREHTLRSMAPALIYEEASLIKRAIRDVYSRDIDEILVDGEPGWRAAHEFMRMLMPTHAKKVQLWREGQPLFAKMQVEAQLDAMLAPTVQLRSGGYLVLNQAEALVAIDVNSGRSTRERGIEETALRTNLEAADEVARQLRLRDLAGLIVIDFIDMESKKHNAMVERRLKDALKTDRARIQVGHISHFGLLEMSRQRLRPSLAETSFVPCAHCGGTGHMRSTESAAIHVLRGIEEEGAKRRAAEIVVHVASPIAMYVLNHKRAWLGEIEARYAMHASFAGDDTLIPPQIRIERLRAQAAVEARLAVTPDQPVAATMAPAAEADAADLDEEVPDQELEVVGGSATGTGSGSGTGTGTGTGAADEEERRRRRRRRRRRGGRREDGMPAADPAALAADATGEETPPAAAEADADSATTAPAEAGVGAIADAGAGVVVAPAEAAGAAPDADGQAEAATARRRGRRGGRRRRREDEATPPDLDADQPALMPPYVGPTPADPFGGSAFDIYDMIDHAERMATAAPPAPAIRVPEPAPTDAPAPPSPGGEADRGPDPDSALHEAILHRADFPVADVHDADLADMTNGAGTASAGAAEPEIKPIVVGSDAAGAEKKRGWWRR